MQHHDSARTVELGQISASEPDHSLVRRCVTVIAIWLAGTGLLAIVLTAEEGLSFVSSFVSSGLQTGILVLLLIPVWMVLPRLDPRSAAVRVCAHLGLAIVLIPAGEIAFHFALGVASSPEVADIRRETSGYWRWLQGAMMYGVVVGGMVIVRTARKLRAEERRASQLQLLMREAELRALRAQLRPHFLFNTLNSIYSLIPERPEEATSMVAKLSDLMRETLELTDQTLIPLDSELRLVRRYLDIEAIRFGDRLTVSVDAGPGTAEALVPPFLLQPLVENAVHHGIAPLVQGGSIRVRAELLPAHAEAGGGAGRLRLSVVDDGCGFEEPSSPSPSSALSPARSQRGPLPGHGNGLRITRSRLLNQYGGLFSMEITSSSEPKGSKGQGTTVSIEIPMAGTRA